MNIVTKVVMHPGTETETVRHILKKLGVQVDVIQSPRQLKTAKFDGLVLLGGVDIAPFYYGEEMLYAHTPNDNRDYIEWNLIRRAMTAGIPIMGICRGHQMITVAHGGSLYQDIYRQKATVSHPAIHRVSLSATLARHVATDLVNSLHHQATRNVPAGFKIAAKSNDGLVEGIYKQGVLGVQWHPEILYHTDHRWIELFHWFVTGLQ
jgi:gamma-glutamyl-gamma-aminobutyrate hydrolase PuuD